MKKFLLSILCCMLAVLSMQAEEVTYTVSSTSAVATSGTAPAGSSAAYSSTYGTKNQLTGGNSMTLTLSGYAGCKITGIKLSMKSNSSKGAGSFSMKVGDTTLSSISDSKFNTSSWYGAWSTSYVDVTPTMSNADYTIADDENVVITIAATANSLYCQSFTITYEGNGGEGGGETPEPEPEEPKVGYTLITSINDLSAGDNVVIVATDANVALSTTQNNNNRGQATVEKSENIVTFGDDVQVMTLEAGSVSGTFAFSTGSGYLYAASSSSNHLKTEATLSANSSWNITIASTGVATIKAQGSNTRNWLRYNSQSSIFSCYGSGQGDVSIYKLYEEGETPAETVDAPILPASTTFEGSYEVTITAGDGVAIYYTLDGNEPTKESTLYDGSFTITETTTVKAIAVKGELVSATTEATYKLVKTLNNCTVAELIEAYVSGDDIAEGATVVGYIVGCIDGTSISNAVFGNEVSEENGDKNILLADDPYETNIDNCIPVQLPSGDVRTALNLFNNSDNYQKKVILTGDVQEYFKVAGLKNTSAYEFVEMFYNTITVSDAGWATLYLPTAARIPSNVEAYTVTAVNDGWVSLTQVKGVIPANTGIIVKANAGEYDLIVGETATADVTGNLLSGSAYPKNIEEEAYVLGKVDGVVGLYKAEMNQMDGAAWLNNANKAYLPASAVPNKSAAFYGFDWDGTTGIEKVEIRNEKSEIYDLIGRRVETITEPGIYIVGGKKVLVK